MRNQQYMLNCILDLIYIFLFLCCILFSILAHIIGQQHNKLIGQQDLLFLIMDSDFQIIKRTSDESGKYAWVKFVQPDIDVNNSIVTSHADMEFKFSPDIYRKFLQKIGQTPQFGYPNAKQSFWKALSDWVTSRYYRKGLINQTTTIPWNNSITSIHGVLENTTKQGDQILIICPVYYFFILLPRFKNRKIVQFQLETKDNRFYINFQKLEQTIKENQIKLVMFCNPWNPCGRIWSRQQLKKIAVLVLKYEFILFSDQIYADVVEPTEQQAKQGLTVQDVFTSFLVFEQIHKYLVFICSYTKAFNSSGLPLCYSICFNPDLHKKLNDYRIFSGGSCNALSYDLLQIIYTSQQAKNWKNKLIKYITSNYKIFRQKCKELLPDLIIYDLECSYLCLVDFCNYKVAGKNLLKKFNSVSVCPTFMELSFDEYKERSLIRINLAMNEKLVIELVERMKKMLETDSVQNVEASKDQK